MRHTRSSSPPSPHASILHIERISIKSALEGGENPGVSNILRNSGSMTLQPTVGSSDKRWRRSRNGKSGIYVATLGEMDAISRGREVIFTRALARFSMGVAQDGDRQYENILSTISVMRRVKSVKNHCARRGGHTDFTKRASVVPRKVGRSAVDSRVSVYDLSSRSFKDVGRKKTR